MNHSVIIPLNQLRVGMFVQLDLNWMQHPFTVGSFRVASEAQIATLRELGLREIRCIPAKSDAAFRVPPTANLASGSVVDATPVNAPMSSQAAATAAEKGVAREAAQRHRMLLNAQHKALALCDQGFVAASRAYLRIGQACDKAPQEARLQSEALVAECVSDLLGRSESVIALLSECVGERNALHPVNVMVLSLLLGKAQELTPLALAEVGLAALLHDVGKVHLPPRLWVRSPDMSALDVLQYEKHVAESIALGQRMGLPDPVLQAIAQHHEMANGHGFPRGLKGGAIGTGGRIVALVNHYDRLCNPAHGAQAFTPHDALSVIFAQHKARFDPEVLRAFIRMMGVYPPGSIVQLVNSQYAMVVAVNSSRPLRPKVIVYDALVPRDQSLVRDLETEPDLVVRTSLKPSQLPRAALDYLSPRSRICYYFERGVPTPQAGADA